MGIRMHPSQAKPEYIPDAWESPSCPVCGSDRRSVVERYGNRKQYTNVSCARCGLLYGCPRPRYGEHFLHAAYAEYVLLRDDHAYGSGYKQDFSDVVREIQNFDHQRSSILDVGCAMGDFLNAAAAAYSLRFGVEVSKKMAGYTRRKLGVEVYEHRFEDLPAAIAQRFSCIHLSHVLEHIPNPNVWIRTARELLVDDGLLVLCVPHGNSADRRCKRLLSRAGLRPPRWRPDMTPDHLFLPTIASMRLLTETNGFVVEAMYTYGRRDILAKSLAGRVFNRALRLGTNLRFYLRKAA